MASEVRHRASGFSAPAWPTPTQEQLLHACLDLNDATARDTWRLWREAVDFDRIDPASMRFMPLLLRRLENLGISDPNLGRYRGLHRRGWVRSQQLLHQLHTLTGQLNQLGIPTLVLKGAAIASRYYGEIGLRPMGDADLLVPHIDAARAIACLVQNGWSPEYQRDPDSLIRHHLDHNHAWGFQNGQGQSVDLHWKLLHLGTSHNLDQRFWHHARSLSLPGFTAQTLSTTHHLFHTLVHGVPLNSVPGFRWVADALMILRNAGAEVDWIEFVACCYDFRVTVLMAHACEYLTTRFQAPIPPLILDRLWAHAVTPWERAEFEHLLQHPPTLHPRFLWHRYRRQRAATPGPHATTSLGGYLDFVRTRWDLPSRWHLPGTFLRKAATVLRNRERDGIRWM